MKCLECNSDAKWKVWYEGATTSMLYLYLMYNTFCTRHARVELRDGRGGHPVVCMKLIDGQEQSEKPPSIDSNATLNDYQSIALRTAVRFSTEADELCRGALGLTGEAGEVAGYIKKHLYHGHGLNKEHLKSELGDVLWYIAVLADFLGFTLEEIATYNIMKLSRRYPEGVKDFETFVDRSLHRQDESKEDGDADVHS